MNGVSALEVRRAPLRTTIGLKQTTKDRLCKTGYRANAMAVSSVNL